MKWEPTFYISIWNPTEHRNGKLCKFSEVWLFFRTGDWSFSAESDRSRLVPRGVERFKGSFLMVLFTNDSGFGNICDEFGVGVSVLIASQFFQFCDLYLLLSNDFIGFIQLGFIFTVFITHFLKIWWYQYLFRTIFTIWSTEKIIFDAFWRKQLIPRVIAWLIYFEALPDKNFLSSQLKWRRDLWGKNRNCNFTDWVVIKSIWSQKRILPKWYKFSI